MSTSLVLPEGLPFVSRKEWAALRPLSHQPLQHPVTHVRITQTRGKECLDRESCSKRLRKLQYDHCYHHGFHDIGFNFMVSPDGTVYEGRGWHFEVERDYELPDLKGRCIDIAYIGKFIKRRTPTGKSVDSVNGLINYGVEAGIIHPVYKLINANEEKKKIDIFA